MKKYERLRPQPAGDWAKMDGELGAFIAEESQKTIEAYRHQPNLLNEHANHEEDTAHGGYAHRQLFELIQNSADALVGRQDGRIDVRLTKDYLYCADNGSPINQDGVTALMFSHMSTKRGTSEIGRFGLGFKSVLGVTDAPEFFSYPGSFRFDRNSSRVRIDQALESGISIKRYPALRLPEPIDPHQNGDKDDILRGLMVWATNIVRLPLKHEAQSDLGIQMRDFPSEFLLFVEHVRELNLKAGLSNLDRVLELLKFDGEFLLADGNTTSQWKLFKHTHRLSDEARADRRSLDDGDEVPIWWALPLDRLTGPGQFWAFFPTKTASLVTGILNAPWKTNEDRQNLLPGSYNDELIKSAANMIADRLPGLATQIDPARHLDALPRRHEAGDSEHADLLRTELFSGISGRGVIPDQNGNLCVRTEISYPPKELTVDHRIDMKPFSRWEAYPARPSDWLHHKALTRNRLAAIDRLFPPEWPGKSPTAPRSTVAEWLEALADKQEPGNIIEGSKAAVQTAALIPSSAASACQLGEIVLTADGGLQRPDPERIFLPYETPDAESVLGRASFVHPQLASDHDTRMALKQLGIRKPSAESSFKLVASEVLGGNGEPHATLLTRFWEQSREASVAAPAIIQGHSGWRSRLRIRVRSGDWLPPDSVLLPGGIVPGDGSRDDETTVDIKFHEPDINLLRDLGVTDSPRGGSDLSSEPWFPNYLSDCRRKFSLRPLRQNPDQYYLNFVSTEGSGPLNVLGELSDEGRALYTEALLSLDITYEPWTMRHDTRDVYPLLTCEPPTVHKLREYGRVCTPSGTVPFKDALGPRLKSEVALRKLLALPKADKIRQTFDLADPVPEFTGEEYPVPLTDVWPGLEKYLPGHLKTCQLVRCERILVGGTDSKCIFSSPSVYLVRMDDDKKRELELVSDELELELNEARINDILLYRTHQEIEERRAAIRQSTTDAERLLKAVGEQALREDLPRSLLAVLEDNGSVLNGVQVAEAAIATYHSGALKQYRWALNHLDPPHRWAGSVRAVDFVRSLGFSSEWAGERKRRRLPFVEVEGPYSLPELHDYQKTIVAKVREMFRNGNPGAGRRRGMISLPTGSGKTRVAVQAIVHAMCQDNFRGGVLWVADRDELCEQAVEAWKQVWSGIGAHGLRLRISRMWAGQPSPSPTSDFHIVVATIQTLNARLRNQPDEYGFLRNFSLIVFDEAHRSIAPTFTSVMQEIGLTRRRKTDEPFLLGLTATPYRGYNEEETARLANRYDANRLDAGVFESDDPQDVISELQHMGVIAEANHEIIEGGVFSLNTEELQQVDNTPWLPQSVEDRIARDTMRTRRIIEAYKSYVAYVDPDWPTLIFATSVEHAKTVAALLNTEGIRSRAVSGDTETLIRRKIVEEFRCGKIKVLVNYGVFREGFDAPKTRAIVVARPVYSPNLYFQMIGRGLRGVKNGGNNRCLILNVRDNIENFQQALAFSELDWLWA